MSRVENRHYTKKWKKKRKNHDGDRCDNADCGICSPHKNIGNSGKFDKPKQKMARKKKIEDDDITDYNDIGPLSHWNDGDSDDDIGPLSHWNE
jgi:hypothetical protein